MRVLVVAPAPAQLRAWVDGLRRGGLAADGARTRAAALAGLDEVPYDAVVAAQDLRDGDGLDLLSRVPGGAALVGVTRAGADGDRLAALRSGVDDCLTPPFPGPELTLRVCKALVRRTEPTGSAVVTLGPVVVDRAARRVARSGRPVPLTRTGLCVFDHLVAGRHRVVPAGELLDHCWDARRDPFSNPLPSQVNRLRAAFAGALAFTWVARGGYRIEVRGEM